MINSDNKIKPDKKLIILGLGLIGGSIAKACQKFNPNYLVEAFDSNPEVTKLAIQQKIISNSYQFNSKLANEDLILIAAPLLSYPQLMEKIKPNLAKQTIIFDIGSLKLFTQNQALLNLKEKATNFVACHPIAGSEKSGLANSDANLFWQKKLIITPHENNDQRAILKITKFWEKLGCEIQLMDAEKHDQIFALISHMPQFLAFILKSIFKDNQLTQDLILKKHQRLENSNATIFEEIFELNIVNLKYYLKLLVANLTLIEEKLTQEQYLTINSFLEKQLKLVSNQREINQINRDLLNQPQMIARLILVSSLISLNDAEKFIIYAGSGFKDFTAILDYLKPFLEDKKSACKILAENKEYLLNFLSKISQQISLINYGS